jgi:hypothetical protein
MVVRFDAAINTYRLSTVRFDEAVYGVVGERPAIVFMTASNTIPIVTQGVTGVLVDTAHNGAITRGDLLTTAPEQGVAMRANLETNEVFAIVLEDMTSGEGVVMAEVGVEQATKIQQERQAAAQAIAAAADSDEDKNETSFVRIAVAIGLTVLALGFLLYSFKSILHSGILSIGRNPRARTSVVWVSMGSMVMVLILVTIVVLVAIGILVLPV